MKQDNPHEKTGKDFTGGGILALSGKRTTTGDPAFDARVDQLVKDWGGVANPDLIEELIISALRLARHDVSVAELKLLNRAVKELRNAWRVFRPFGNRRKVAVYGSARTRPDEPEAKAAERFSRRMVEEGFMIITGAGDGIMGAAQKGAGADNSFGLNIRLPFEQEANETIGGDPKLVPFNYFFTRKLTFVKESEGFALFPGGFGTMDEGFEVLTLMQTGKTAILPLVMVDVPGANYWKTFDRFLRDELLSRRLISVDDFALFRITDDIEEAVHEFKHFYRIFHSYRFVRDQFVVRLQRKLSDAQLAQLNADFGDLVASGSIQQSEALPQELDEETITHLPRLVFRLQRRNYGRLRRFIDAINDCPSG
ncbi:MAG: TIGR00730 family Rossman fold protein [Verrucomicrobiota bacterium]